MIQRFILLWWHSIVFIVGRVRRPLLTAQERLPAHRAEVQSFQRTWRAWATGVNPVMVPANMVPLIVGVHAGYNIWFEPSQGFYWVDGFEPAFWTQEEARAYAASQVTPITEVEVKSALPLMLIIGAIAALI